MTSPFDSVLANPRLNNAEGRMPLVYGEVHEERIRAHMKHGAKGNSREDAGWDDREWLPILMEELGEVAHEWTYDVRPEATIAEAKAALRAELIQVAAMACAWIAAIDAL